MQTAFACYIVEVYAYKYAYQDLQYHFVTLEVHSLQI